NLPTSTAHPIARRPALGVEAPETDQFQHHLLIGLPQLVVFLADVVEVRDQLVDGPDQVGGRHRDVAGRVALAHAAPTLRSTAARTSGSSAYGPPRISSTTLDTAAEPVAAFNLFIC